MAEMVIKEGSSVQSSSVKMSSSSSTSSSALQMSSSTKMNSSNSSQVSSSSKQSESSKKTVSSAKSVSSSTSSSYSSFSSSSVSIKSSSTSFADTFGKQLGLDPESELLKLTAGMGIDEKMASMRREMFKLMPLELGGGGADKVTKLDSTSIKDYVDKDNADRLRFNFDVNEFQSESINIKCDGNKIEVHAKKSSKKGDEEASDEYCRTYELPTSQPIDSGTVTSSFFKDGVLTVELPFGDTPAEK